MHRSDLMNICLQAFKRMNWNWIFLLELYLKRIFLQIALYMKYLLSGQLFIVWYSAIRKMKNSSMYYVVMTYEKLPTQI